MLKLNMKTDNEAYWDEFYEQQNLLFGESSFAGFVHKWINQKAWILDIGCGSGRDSFYFANKGHKVIGVDRSIEAIKINKEKVEKSNSNVDFYNIDLKKQEELLEIIEPLSTNAEKEDLPLIIYLRFLLHSIDEDTEEKLLSVISNNINSGSYIAAEFRTIEDKNRSKVYDNHYRRYITSEKLLKKLQSKYLFENKFFTKGTGLSLYKGEDPYLARILMRTN